MLERGMMRRENDDCCCENRTISEMASAAGATLAAADAPRGDEVRHLFSQNSMVLPRQARDKHRKTLNKEAFSAGCPRGQTIRAAGSDCLRPLSQRRRPGAELQRSLH